jgi:hypothetical protein
VAGPVDFEAGCSTHCSAEVQPVGLDRPPGPDQNPNPEGDLTMRFMGLLKADKESEAGVPPSLELMQRCEHFMEEITKAGVLIASDGLQPSSAGKRVRLAGGKVTVTDGPFTESKELIASYALFEVESMAEAVEWTTRFLNVLGTGECEIRPLFESPPDGAR